MKATLKWVGIAVGALFGLLILAMLGLYGMGQMRLNKKYDVPVQMVAIPTDAESLSEGKRIFQYRGCEACHGEDLQGLVYMDNPALGQVITPNLTSGQGGIGNATHRRGFDPRHQAWHPPRRNSAPVHAIH